MLAALRGYGEAAARQVVGTGVQVRIWDIGNKVEFGVAGVAVKPMPGSCDDTTGGKNWYRTPDAVDPAIGKITFHALVGMTEEKRSAWLAEHIWPHEARMLAAVANGIRTVDPTAHFSTHISGVSATGPALATEFFKAMKQGGFPADELVFLIVQPLRRCRKTGYWRFRRWRDQHNASWRGRCSLRNLAIRRE